MTRLLDSKIISEEEVEIVQYGLDAIVSNFIGLVITLVIGSCFGYNVDSIILWLLLFSLRKYAGGYHAETRGKCIFCSTGILIVSFILYTQVNWFQYISLEISILLASIIFFMAPVENANKGLDMVEKIVYRKRTRIVLLAQILILYVSILFSWERMVELISICFFVVGISLLIGKLKLRQSDFIRPRKKEGKG